MCCFILDPELTVDVDKLNEEFMAKSEVRKHLLFYTKLPLCLTVLLDLLHGSEMEVSFLSFFLYFNLFLNYYIILLYFVVFLALYFLKGINIVLQLVS